MFRLLAAAALFAVPAAALSLTKDCSGCPGTACKCPGRKLVVEKVEKENKLVIKDQECGTCPGTGCKCPGKNLVLKKPAEEKKEANEVVKKTPFMLELGNYQNVQYFANITIGGQTLPAIYDTGSFEILTLSVRCPKCKAHASKDAPLYDHTVSMTYQGEGTRVEHVFGSGPVVSQKGFDTILIGDKGEHEAKLPAYGPALKHMDFWQIEDHQIGAWEAGARFSAIVGLGPKDHVPPLTRDQKENPVPTLLERSNVDDFGICLQRKSTVAQIKSQHKFAPGWLKFNAPPSKKADSKVDVVGQVHWGVKMSHFGILNDPSKTNVCAGGCGAIVDSGTSLIAAPKEVLMQMEPFLSQVQRDCSNVDKLPNLEFSLGSGDRKETFVLPPKAYVMKVTSADIADTSIWDWVMGTPKIKLVNTCMPAFMPLDKHSQFGPVFILGMPFLRYFKTTFVRSSPPMMYFDAVDQFCEPLPEAEAAKVNMPTPKVEKKDDGEGLKAGHILLKTAANMTATATVETEADMKMHARAQYLSSMFNTEDDKSYQEVDLNDIVRPKWAASKDFVF